MNDVTSEVSQQPTEAQDKPKRGRNARSVSAKARAKEIREKRVPLGRSVLKLDFESYKEPGWAYYVFVDRPGRLAQAQAGGWEFVTDPEKAKQAGEGIDDTNVGLGTAVTAIMDSKVGDLGYLMRIPEEIYSEAQADKQRSVDEIDAAIHGGVNGDDLKAEGDNIVKKSGHGLSHSKTRTVQP
jgi:hypothetical protein